MSLRFDAGTHTYTWADAPVPSVTQALEEAGIVDYWRIPEPVCQMALERGRAVHLAAQWDDEGVLARCPESLAGYLVGWRAFRANYGVELQLIEHRGFNPAYRYAGTLDRTGLIGGGSSVALIDLKTNESPWWVRLQLAAYAAFFEKPRTFRRMAVELHSDGSYRVDEFPSREWQSDFNDFLAALSVANLKRRYAPQTRGDRAA
jgi:hypothetical protein